MENREQVLTLPTATPRRPRGPASELLLQLQQLSDMDPETPLILWPRERERGSAPPNCTKAAVQEARQG